MITDPSPLLITPAMPTTTMNTMDTSFRIVVTVLVLAISFTLRLSIAAWRTAHRDTTFFTVTSHDGWMSGALEIHSMKMQCTSIYTTCPLDIVILRGDLYFSTVLFESLSPCSTTCTCTVANG